MKKLLLHNLHVDWGARFTDFGQYTIPDSYATISKELKSVFSNVSIVDRSYLGKIKVSGKDALDLLDRITTNDLKYLTIGTVCDTIFITPKGRIIDYCRIINCGEEYLIICSQLKTQHLIDWINRFIILEDVQVTDASFDYIWLTLLGPHSRQFLSFYSNLPVLENDEVIWLNFNNTAFPALKNTNFKVPAYNFCLENKLAEEMLQSFVSTLHSMKGMLIGNQTFQIIRVESGMPEMDAELSEEHNPHEARLLNAVSFTKGCYTGQEVIARLDAYDKVQRYLMIVELNKKIKFKSPLNVFIDDEDIGKLTSFVHNPLSKRNIGLGYIKKIYSTRNDTYIEVKDGTKRIPGRLLKPPQAYQ